MSSLEIAALEFALISDLIGHHAKHSPDRPAIIVHHETLSYSALDALMDRIAARLQSCELKPGDCIAMCAGSSVNSAAVFLGSLRAGIVVAPLAPGTMPESFRRMLNNCDAKLLFTDSGTAESDKATERHSIPCISLDGSNAGEPIESWLSQTDRPLAKTAIDPGHPFNIIYSSGTTGEPKGIVQPHSMRWAHVRRGAAYGYGSKTRMLLSTPLYSNTTLVVFFPTLAYGGTVVLMPKFDVQTYLHIAQDQCITHTMLVPVQYQRLMAAPNFDAFDLHHFEIKFSTSAPFSAALKADVLKRWHGGLVEFYGMTEGGGTCILEAHLFPEKLHTVGRPAQGHDIRLISDEGVEVSALDSGEVVGRSGSMMKGYHGQDQKTREAEWYDPDGKRFIRTGDVGRFDEDGFLTLFDRKKDMIISGGFNIYPSDLESVVCDHPNVLEASVVGVPSEQWGETPVAFVVLKNPDLDSSESLLNWINAKVGKTQRLAKLFFIDQLPRSPIGKVLKRELRDRHLNTNF